MGSTAMESEQNLVEEYQKLRQGYERLDQEIDALLAKSGGNSDQMPHEDLNNYRAMFRKRSEIQNDLRILEQQLLGDDS